MSYQVNSSVINALSILEFLAASRSQGRLKDIAEALSLPESTTHRLLSSLGSKGYVQQSAIDQTYSLGLKVLTLARTLDYQADLIKYTHVFLERLAEKSGYTANLAVLQQDHVVYLDCVTPTQSKVALYTAPGTAFPIHATGLGKALLAYRPAKERNALLARLEFERHTPATISNAQDFSLVLDSVRERGYAVDKGEFVAGVCCLAAPILGPDGLASAAMSVSAPISQLDVEAEVHLGRLIWSISRDASEALYNCRSMAQDEGGRKSTP